ncbi:predicted protein [Sclerotinia sclerotiorum 1980 UF-70]|uniref:Uncharacterized protein n=1 Tax=Sclerotinia sclerotiorum (strain ATCC 18683 / 1980 / Ss-1) TaxID=665079 RepID=A7F9E0_SCLS1|nr:predicted protein [Sclerotinia sclerotiorum 1980 UF-70]EDO00351.1 predicted protein [Sclerotinia sclerotiorum 1980 UF-70]
MSQPPLCQVPRFSIWGKEEKIPYVGTRRSMNERGNHDINKYLGPTQLMAFCYFECEKRQAAGQPGLTHVQTCWKAAISPSDDIASMSLQRLSGMLLFNRAGQSSTSRTGDRKVEGKTVGE